MIGRNHHISMLPFLSLLISLSGCNNISPPEHQRSLLAPLTCAQPTWAIGTIEGGLYVEHEFTVTNDSSGPCNVISVTGDCGCLAVPPISTQILPGKQFSIPVKITIPYDGSHFKHHVLVKYSFNSKEIPLILEVNGKSTPCPQLRADPLEIDFGKVSQRGRMTLTKDIIISRFDESALDFIDIDTSLSEDAIKGEVISSSIPNRLILRVSLNCTHLPNGRHNFYLTMRCGGNSKYRSIQIPAHIVIDLPPGIRSSLYYDSCPPNGTLTLELFDADKQTNINIVSASFKGRPAIPITVANSRLGHLQIDLRQIPDFNRILADRLIVQASDNLSFDIPVTLILTTPLQKDSTK